MSTEVINVEVDSEAARVFNTASDEEREKIQFLFVLCLKELARADVPSLRETMDEISRKAQSRGLTPEVLNSILEEE